MNLPSHRTKTHTDWLSEIQGQENTDHNKRSGRCLRWMVSSQENKPHQVKTKRAEMLFQTSLYFSKRTTRRRLLSAAVDQKGNARRGIKKKKKRERLQEVNNLICRVMFWKEPEQSPPTREDKEERSPGGHTSKQHPHTPQQSIMCGRKRKLAACWCFSIISR